MNVQQFLHHLEDALNASSGTFQIGDCLRELEGWDSIGILAIIAAIDREYAVVLEFETILQSNTVSDLWETVQRVLERK